VNVVSTAVTLEGAGAATMGAVNLLKADVVTSSGQKADPYGNKLGLSGKQQVNEVDHSTKSAAKDAARQD
jgi:hypothetical protein